MSGGRWPWPPERTQQQEIISEGIRALERMLDARAARIAELEKQHSTVLVEYHVGRGRIAELEAAIDKLAAGKGRYHTEANYLALITVRNKSLHK